MTQKQDDSDWKDGFLFLGNHLALDFVNTRPVVKDEPVELLPDVLALLRWFRAAGLVDSSEFAALRQEWGESARARRLLESAREFREQLRNEILRYEEAGIV